MVAGISRKRRLSLDSQLGIGKSMVEVGSIQLPTNIFGKSVVGKDVVVNKESILKHI
jgi:hypothetical protein